MNLNDRVIIERPSIRHARIRNLIGNGCNRFFMRPDAELLSDNERSICTR